MAKVLYLSHVNAGTPNDIGNGYLRELQKHGAVFLDYSELYLRLGRARAEAAIRDKIKETGADTLIYAAESSSFHFRPAFFHSLRPAVFTVMMAGDTAYYFDLRDKYYAGAMDLLAIYDSYESVEAFRRLGGDAVMFLSSYDTAIYRRLPDAKKTIDVSFVGGYAGRSDRAAYIDHLRSHGIAVQTFGYGTPGGQVSLERMVEIFNQSRINLNFTGASVGSRLVREPVPGRKQLKGRIAEAALCGGFVLSETAPGIENILRPGEEMDVFAAKEELLEKVSYYLADEACRERIAARGWLQAQENYDVKTSIPRLLAEIDKRRAARKAPVLLVEEDAAFGRHFASYRLLYFLRFLKRLSPALALGELFDAFNFGPPHLGQFYTFFVEEIVDPFPRLKKFLKGLAGA